MATFGQKLRIQSKVGSECTVLYIELNFAFIVVRHITFRSVSSYSYYCTGKHCTSNTVCSLWAV